jgi:hypothetical protein
MTISIEQAAFNLAVALVQSSVIGFERQWHNRLAGLRTNTLVTLGATSFVVFERLIPDRTSQSRVAAQFVPGIEWRGLDFPRRSERACGILGDCRYLLHDHDTKFTQSFRAIIASGQVEPLARPARSPNLNAYAECWVRSVKEELVQGYPLWRAFALAGPE